nr:hypothetical protein [Tanacetum cinerariifolium]
MLVGKNGHGPVKYEHVVDARALGALALVVDDACPGKVPVLPAALGEAVREVDVLAVHKVVFVEQAHLVEGGLAQQHVGAAEYRHLVRLAGVEKPEVEATLAVEHLHAQPAAVGVLVHKSAAPLKGVFLHERVGVEQQLVLACGAAQRLVISYRKAGVMLVLNKDDLREARLHHRHRVVG